VSRGFALRSRPSVPAVRPCTPEKWENQHASNSAAGNFATAVRCYTRILPPTNLYNDFLTTRCQDPPVGVSRYTRTEGRCSGKFSFALTPFRYSPRYGMLLLYHRRLAIPKSAVSGALLLIEVSNHWRFVRQSQRPAGASLYSANPHLTAREKLSRFWLRLPSHAWVRPIRRLVDIDTTGHPDSLIWAIWRHVTALPRTSQQAHSFDLRLRCRGRTIKI